MLDMVREFITCSAKETFELAYRMGESLHSSTIFLLTGELGAGKTVFAKGIAAGLDIDPADVTSPTFTIVNIYAGRMKLFHLDLYRLSGSDNELYEIGLEEIIAEENAITLIEWPERLGAFKIPYATHLQIMDEGHNQRKIVITESPVPCH